MKKLIAVLALLIVVPVAVHAFDINWGDSTVNYLISASEKNETTPRVGDRADWSQRNIWIEILEDQGNRLLEQAKKLRAQNDNVMAGSSCLDLKNSLIIGSTDAGTGGEVSKLQLFLKAKGFFADAQGTGYYGPKTADAVVRFQKSVGMDFVTTKSGVGPMTRAKMKCGNPNVSVQGVNWVITQANPTATGYQADEQAISVDVTFADNTTKRYSLGTSYGCAVVSPIVPENGKTVLGKLNCYYALSGNAFTAFIQGGQFIVEKYQDDASGITNGKYTTLLRF